MAKNWGYKGAPGISRLLVAAKLLSTRAPITHAMLLRESVNYAKSYVFVSHSATYQ